MSPGGFSVPGSLASASLLNLVQVVAEDLGPGRVAQLRHSLRLDLPDPLAGDPVDLADLVQRLRLTVGQAEPHAHDAGLALGERVQDRVELLLEERKAHRFTRLDRLGVLDQVTELAVAVLAERRVQRNRLPAGVAGPRDPLPGPGHV